MAGIAAAPVAASAYNPEVLAAAHRKVIAMALKGMEGRGFEEMVPMKDGTKLYTYGVLPPEGVKCGIVLQRTPYVQEKPADVAAFVRGQQKALARGYAYIVQHVRGTGMSEGDWIPYVNERADGLATLEWLRRLPCYNGEIYVSGISYLSSVHWSYLRVRKGSDPFGGVESGGVAYPFAISRRPFAAILYFCQGECGLASPTRAM